MQASSRVMSNRNSCMPMSFAGNIDFSNIIHKNKKTSIISPLILNMRTKLREKGIECDTNLKTGDAMKEFKNFLNPNNRFQRKQTLANKNSSIFVDEKVSEVEEDLINFILELDFRKR